MFCFQLPPKMIHILSLILLFKSSDSSDNEMLIDDTDDKSYISELKSNYKPLVFFLQPKNTRSEIKEHKSMPNLNIHDLKYIMNTLVPDVEFKDFSTRVLSAQIAKNKVVSEKSSNSDKNRSSDNNDTAHSKDIYDLEKKNFYKLYVPFNNFYETYCCEKLNFINILKECNMILKTSIGLVKEKKPLNVLQRELKEMIENINTQNKKYCDSYNKIKDYVNNLSDERIKILDKYTGYCYDDSLYDLICELWDAKIEWNALITGKR